MKTTEQRNRGIGLSRAAVWAPLAVWVCGPLAAAQESPYLSQNAINPIQSQENQAAKVNAEVNAMQYNMKMRACKIESRLSVGYATQRDQGVSLDKLQSALMAEENAGTISEDVDLYAYLTSDFVYKHPEITPANMRSAIWKYCIVNFYK